MRQLFESLQQPLSFDASVRIHVSHDDVDARGTGCAGRFEHRIGFANSRRCSKINLETPASVSCLLALDRIQYLIRIARLNCDSPFHATERPAWRMAQSPEAYTDSSKKVAQLSCLRIYVS
jgi:putative heme iron utilization protein